MKREFVAVRDNGVSCVGTALVAADTVKLTLDEVGNRTFALITPLRTNKYSCRHEDLPLLRITSHMRRQVSADTQRSDYTAWHSSDRTGGALLVVMTGFKLHKLRLLGEESHVNNANGA